MVKKSTLLFLLSMVMLCTPLAKAEDQLADPAVGKKIVYNGVMYSFLSLTDKTVSTVYTMGTNADMNGEKCPKLTGDVVIPSKITYKDVDYTVTEIGTFTFMYPSGVDANLTSVTLPETITQIGNSAFAGNANLTKVNIPAACKTLGAMAFQRCTALTSLTIPEGVEVIGNQCFNSCGLTEIILPNSVNLMGDAAITSLPALKKVVVGTGLKAIPMNGISTNNVLEEIDLGKVEKIGNLGLSNLPALKTLHLPATLKEFGDRALILQDALTSYTVDPENPYLTTVNGVLYSKDKSVLIKYPLGLTATSFEISEGVKRVEDCAFDHATYFESFKLPTTLETIGKYAFWENSKLTSLDFSKCKLSDIDEGAFTLCYGLKSVKLSNTPIKIGDLTWYENKALTNVDLGGATYLGDLVFSRCSSLENVVIPASVSYLGCTIFSECSAFKSVTVAPESTYFTAVDNVIFSKDMATIVTYPEVLPATEYTVPASVKTIYFGCFMDCVNLISINTGDNTEVIEGSAFSRCSELTTLTFGPKLKDIGNGATLNCNALKLVYMYPTTPPVYKENNKFPYNMNSKGTLYVPKGTLATYQAATPWNSVKDIQEMEGSGINDLVSDNGNPEIIATKGVIRIENSDNAVVEVYNLVGQLVYSGVTDCVTLPSGIYVVRCGKTTTKVNI